LLGKQTIASQRKSKGHLGGGTLDDKMKNHGGSWKTNFVMEMNRLAIVFIGWKMNERPGRWTILLLENGRKMNYH